VKFYLGLAEKVFPGGRVWGVDHAKGWQFLISKKPKNINPTRFLD
jgi:hypothetical protein